MPISPSIIKFYSNFYNFFLVKDLSPKSQNNVTYKILSVHLNQKIFI